MWRWSRRGDVKDKSLFPASCNEIDVGGVLQKYRRKNEEQICTGWQEENKK